MVKGKARHGVSLVYRESAGELRFTNLATDEIRDTIEHLGRPDDITTSKENPESKEEDRKEEAQRIANMLRTQHGFRPLVFNRPPKPRTITEYDQEIGLIRRALKQLCPTLSVRRDRGTAYSWIDIHGSLEFGEFTEEEKRALEKLGLNCGGNCALISPEDRRHYVEKAARMLGGIPPELEKSYRERDEWAKERRERVKRIEAANQRREAGPTRQETGSVTGSNPEKREFEQMKRNIATGIGTSPEKVEFVNRWLAYLIKELKEIKDREGKERLAAMCIAALADEAEIKPDRERPSYIG